MNKKKKPPACRFFVATVSGEREFFIDNLLVQIHLIIEMIWWTGLAPWEFEFPFQGSLIPTFLVMISQLVLERFTSTFPLLQIPLRYDPRENFYY